MELDQEPTSLLSTLRETYMPHELTWTGTFEDYLKRIVEHPATVRTAHQRLYDSLAAWGQTEYQFLRNKITRFNVLDDPFTPNHKRAIYGRSVDVAFMKIFRVFKAAAQRLGQESRMYLLKGPVGTAKSTFSDLCADAIEAYSKTNDGRLFSPYWEVDKDDEEGMEILGTLTRKFERTVLDCPLHEEPLRVLPLDIRQDVINVLNEEVGRSVKAGEIKPTFMVEGNACPRCDKIFESFMRRYDYNWKKVIEKHLRIRRYVLSRAKRQGIVVARPKSEKDQDVTEFLGSTNYTNLAAYGSVTDPRTFDWAGHYMAANRAVLIFEEQLKFALAFLYDCLGATQEHRVQPRGFMEIDTDLAIIGTTNLPEYEKLQKDPTMEALRDRMIIIEVPYILEHTNEIKIYSKFFSGRTGGKHLAPRSIYLAAYYALLTRLEKPRRTDISLRDKLKLYDGREVAGLTQDAIPELQKESEGEGMRGLSPRYVHDKISAAFMAEDGNTCVNFFAVIKELQEGIKDHQHITSKEEREEYRKLASQVIEELHERIQEDVQKAVAEEEDDIKELFENYMSQLVSFVNKEKVKDPITGEDVAVDTDWMKSIENKIGVTDNNEFRQKIVNQMQKRAFERERDPSKEPFDYKSDERLYRALLLHRFDQIKDNITWERLISKKTIGDPNKKSVSDDDRTLDKVKQNLINMKFGPSEESYCEVCASAMLVYYASAIVRAKASKK